MELRGGGGTAAMLAGFTVNSAESKQTTRKTLIHQHMYVVGLYLGPKLLDLQQTDSLLHLSLALIFFFFK